MYLLHITSSSPSTHRNIQLDFKSEETSEWEPKVSEPAFENVLAFACSHRVSKCSFLNYPLQCPQAYIYLYAAKLTTDWSRIWIGRIKQISLYVLQDSFFIICWAMQRWWKKNKSVMKQLLIKYLNWHLRTFSYNAYSVEEKTHEFPCGK